jgi:hypothetical protein
MYLAPVVIGYGFILGMWAYQIYVTAVQTTYVLIFIFSSFFMAFDLTLVVYVLYLKIKEKIDYISIDQHIYVVTLYRGIYVRTIDKKTYKNRQKEFYNKESQQFENKASSPIFTKMITCGNIECENYGQELSENEKVCPLCGSQIGKFAYVFTKMKTCINPQCEYYGAELDENLEECPQCGRRTGRFAFKVRQYLVLPAIIIALSSIVVFNLISWFTLSADMVGPIIDIIGVIEFCISIISIGMGISSKNKKAIIITIAAFIVTNVIGVFLSYMII